jgi:hypothetical protein
MSKFSKVMLAGVAAIGLGTGFASSAFADTPWQWNHPRREQVNERLAYQYHRINRDYREGEISWARAQRMHRADRQIRAEERMMASQNGGHITRLEQRALNQQENAVSRRIGY